MLKTGAQKVSIKDLLAKLDIGNSVAEFDVQLQSYFLETQIYMDFINDKYDIISGDKGTGKTAIYKIVRDRYRSIPELKDVELIAGFNDSGNPIFRRLSETEILSEVQYITIWKNYIISLIGNYILDVCEGAYTQSMEELDRILQALDLRTRNASASTVFSRILDLINRIRAEIELRITETGFPAIWSRLDFSGTPIQEVNHQRIINSDDALQILDQCLSDLDIRVWMILDRLDEAFAGFQNIEIPALRALLRTYLDMQAYTNIKLKLFVRNDLFRKVIKGGFVNLTHVNARRIEIRWLPEDLFSLLCRRIKNSEDFLNSLGVSADIDDEALFSIIFPPQIDKGSKKPKTWNWILARIRDGNNVLPPRNLIDLVNETKQAQLRREERNPREFKDGVYLFEPDALKRGLEALSEKRVHDTLLAESGEIAQYIEAFKGSKAEHNKETIKRILGVTDEELERILDELKSIGFLEVVGENYKIPMLYRIGLNITQGKAFS